MINTPIDNLTFADVAPAIGFDFEGAVVMARHGNQLLIEHRLPIGTLMQQNNDAHVLGWFMAIAARELLPVAREAYRRALQKQEKAGRRHFIET